VTKTPAQLDAEIAETLRAKQWQEQIEREHRERQSRLTQTGPSPEQLYEEHAADVAAGISHGDRRGRARSFRKVTSVADALRWSEKAKQLSDDAYSADDHREAAEMHRRTALLHKSGGDPAGAEVAWLHNQAVNQHRQATKARAAASKTSAERALQKSKTWAAYQEKIAAASDHQHMAQEYARQALAAARKRT
jgi:hypothetical protein